MKNQYAKSCIRVYNNASQTFVEDSSVLTLEGTPVVCSGCSLELNSESIRVNKSGLYHVAADVTYTPSAEGTAVVQLYKDGFELPCAIHEESVAAGTTYTAHVETDLCLNVCCVNRPALTLRVGGVVGTVSHLCVGAVKLA